MKLRIAKARIEQLNSYPGEDAPSCVLVLKAPLTHKTAEDLRCKEVVYDTEGVIRGSIEGKISLSLSVNGADLILAGTTSTTPSIVHKFKIVREEHGKGDERDVAVFVTFRSKFAGKEPVRVLANFLNSVNSSEFNVVLDAKQESFEFEAKAEPGPEDTEDEAAAVQ